MQLMQPTCVRAGHGARHGSTAHACAPALHQWGVPCVHPPHPHQVRIKLWPHMRVGWPGCGVSVNERTEQAGTCDAYNRDLAFVLSLKYVKAGHRHAMTIYAASILL